MLINITSKKINYNGDLVDSVDANQELKIVYITDRKFLKYAIVSAASVILNTLHPVKLYFIYSDLADNEIEKARITLIQDRVKVVFIPANTEKYKRYISDEKRRNFIAYVKYEIANLIPEERVIYIDVDTLIVRDILALWKTNFINSSIMAVRNPEYPKWKDRDVLNFKADQATFNSGVMVLNLNRLREYHSDLKLYQFSNDYFGRLSLHDEPAWNYVFQNDWEELPVIFNMTTLYYRRSAKILGMTKLDYRKAMEDQVIIHFTGMDKPWKFQSPHPMNDNWRQVYRYVFGETITFEHSFKDSVKKVLRKIKFYYSKHQSKFSV